VIQKQFDSYPREKCPNRYTCDFEGLYRVQDGQFLGFPYCAMWRNASTPGGQQNQVRFFVPKQFENDTIHTRAWCEKNVAMPDATTTAALLKLTDYYKSRQLDNIYWLGKTPDSSMSNAILLDSDGSGAILILANSTAVESQTLKGMLDLVTTQCIVPNSTTTADCLYYVKKGNSFVSQAINYEGPVGYKHPTL
jgi:hypothetical protein